MKRLHSRLVFWNLLVVALISVVLAFFVTGSHLALMAVIAALLTSVFAYLAWALVTRRVNEMAASATKLAAGHLNERLPIMGNDEIASLAVSLNTMVRSLGTTIHDLADRRQRLELIFEAMKQGVMVLDRAGRVTLVNTAILEVLGTERDLSGRTPLEIFRRPELENAVRAVIAGDPSQILEIAAGNGRILQANVAPVTNVFGEVDSAVVVFHDLTDIRRTEKMRRDFVANVSHEFKTPLTSIRGYAETLLSGAKDDPKIALDFLRTIERNAKHLEDLVTDLLVLARLEAEVPARKDTIDLKTIIEEQLSSRKTSVDERKLRVTLECAAIDIHADRSRLAAALSNLIDNAIYYNKPGGDIRISAEIRNGQLAIAVADTGYGIPSGELPRIFERFYRVDKARARESGGTGLGLSIVKHAIESQGGTIGVSSRIGQGSTFTISLPV
jgi:two-component system, OmpR family, phosphate regulon sensor histidine kinase PhoR